MSYATRPAARRNKQNARRIKFNHTYPRFKNGLLTYRGIPAIVGYDTGYTPKSGITPHWGRFLTVVVKFHNHAVADDVSHYVRALQTMSRRRAGARPRATGDWAESEETLRREEGADGPGSDARKLRICNIIAVRGQY